MTKGERREVRRDSALAKRWRKSNYKSLRIIIDARDRRLAA
mgnify:CR=1 FL=1